MFRRRKVTLGDFVSGAFASLRNGTIANPLITQKFINRAHDLRTFGNGESHESRTFDAPVHALTEDGREVTVAFGKHGTSREGHLLIADGHLTGDNFYRNARSRQKGHDHIGPDGTHYADRGRSR